MSWIQTYTGRQFHFLEPQAEDIDVRDIAHALANACRYAGHCDRFYSVAEHSVLVSRHVPREHALFGLLHDAAEAYLPDIPSPMKEYLPQYRDMEDRIFAAIAEAFGLPLGTPAEVKNIDFRMLLDERAALMKEPPAPWVCDGLAPVGAEINGWTPGYAKAQFLLRFKELAH